jgi:hypothetical protein
MRDLQLPLKTAYFTELTNLGLTAFEKDAVPKGAVTPYVIISEIDSKEDSNKTDFGHKAAVLLDIVTKAPINQIGGGKQRDLIANEIFGVINSKTLFIIDDHFQSVSLKITSDRNLNGDTDTYRVYRRLIRFEHNIRQLN